jgi:hypothetical protein
MTFARRFLIETLKPGLSFPKVILATTSDAMNLLRSGISPTEQAAFPRPLVPLRAKTDRNDGSFTPLEELRQQSEESPAHNRPRNCLRTFSLAETLNHFWIEAMLFPINRLSAGCVIHGL